MLLDAPGRGPAGRAKEPAYRSFPRDRLAPRRVGGGPAAPELRRVHPRRPHLRGHHRDHRLAHAATQRYDWLSHELVKLTFAAFSTTALLGALLLFLFVGYYPKFWTYMTSIFFPTYWVYALLFFAETFTVYLWYYGWDWLQRLAQVDPRRPRRAVQPLRHRHPVRRQLVGDVHDLAGRHRRVGRPEGRRVGGHQQLHLDADQHPPADRQHRLRRHDRRRLRGLPLPRRQDRRGARPLRLDGLHRQLRRALGLHRPAVRRLLAGPRDLRLQPDDGHHDDGRLHVVALDHPGHPHRHPVPRLELLPVARAWSASPAPSATASTCRRC